MRFLKLSGLTRAKYQHVAGPRGVEVRAREGDGARGWEAQGPGARPHLPVSLSQKPR